MAKYKLESTLTNGIQFGDRFIGIPGEAELSDAEVEIAKKVATVSPADSSVEAVATPDEYVLNKHQESKVEKIVGDDVEEQAPTKLDK